ncbi:MAG: hypothetical protein ACR2P9_07795 [Gammaproteobacteria bacterium]
MASQYDRRKFLETALKLPLVASATYAGIGFRLTFATDIDKDVLNDHQAATLQQFCYRLFPFDEVGEDPYRLAVSAISMVAKEDEAINTMLTVGVASLDKAQDNSWLELDEEEQISAMQNIEQGEFFQWIYRMAVNQIFTHVAVWEHIGYEGSSMEFGGYLDNGFDDIDWL